MNTKQTELLQKLEQFQLDSPEAALPFSARLGRENNWTPAYTQRVITEYKRFAFLAVAAGHPVSPSEDVDQVWHSHLTYSENYWKVFCPQVLGQSFHHQPTRGGPMESAKFDDWYARTLASYELFFGAPPPSDIWPSAETRRQEKHQFVRVDRARNWVVPKIHRRLNPAFALWTGLLGTSLLCTGAMMAQGMNVFDWRGPDFLVFYVLLFAACFGVALWWRWKLRAPATGDLVNLPELDGYEMAYLNGGNRLAVDTAIVNLVNRNALQVPGKSNRIFGALPVPELSHDFESRIFTAANATDGNTIGNIRSTMKPILDRMRTGLIAQGLVVSDEASRKGIALPLTVALASVVIGIVKIVVGVHRDKPVGYLVGLCAISLIASLLALARRPRRSRYGDAVLHQLQERHANWRRMGGSMTTLAPPEFAAAVGLFGMGMLARTGLDPVRKTLYYQGGGDGCGGSSGCGGGGGGCGGGGGGCGGCGGH